jgi:hypothetical protein
MKYPLLASVLALVIASCTGTKEAQYPPLNLKVAAKTFQFSSAQVDGDSSAVASYKVNYPVFEGLDEKVQLKVTYKLDSILTQGYSEGLPLTIQQASQEFVHQYEEYKMEDPQTKQGWYFSANVGVNILSDSLISMVIFRDEFTGGNHANRRKDFLNINPHTGEDVFLAHELEEGFENELIVIAEKTFRAVRQIPETASLSSSYFDFPEDKFKLTNTYGFTKHGIVFYYNNYEVAPYAIGPTEVIVPYAKVRDWLR